VTNGERADRFFAEANAIQDDLRSALARGRWNLAARRAQEVVELLVKGLLNELGTDYPRVHDPVPVLVQAIRDRRLAIDLTQLEWLSRLSAKLTELRAPAFYQEVTVSEAEARQLAREAERASTFARDLLALLRRG
jgi:HEPN domain-containing protein